MKNQNNEMDLILSSNKQNGALWLGNIKSAQNIIRLNKENITSVLTVINATNLKYPKHQKINHLIIEIKDNEKAQIIDVLDQACDFIEKSLKLGSVLVHCVAGISRSVSCVIAYLIKNNRWTFLQAFDFVKQKRKIANPNGGFKKQLIQFAQKFEIKEEQKQLTLNELRRKLYKSPAEVASKTNLLLSSPQKRITQLNQYSTQEEKQLYRQQMAQKLFVKTFEDQLFSDQVPKIMSPKSQQSQLKKKIPITKKAHLSMYHSVQEQVIGYQSERLY